MLRSEAPLRRVALDTFNFCHFKLKGTAMINYQAGLHKDVAKIFDGVWTPQIDNIQPAVSVSYKQSGAFVYPKPLALSRRPEIINDPKRPEPSKTWSFFSSRARRERKRLSSISKHLLINLPDSSV